MRSKPTQPSWTRFKTENKNGQAQDTGQLTEERC